MAGARFKHSQVAGTAVAGGLPLAEHGLAPQVAAVDQRATHSLPFSSSPGSSHRCAVPVPAPRHMPGDMGLGMGAMPYSMPAPSAEARQMPQAPPQPVPSAPARAFPSGDI